MTDYYRNVYEPVARAAARAAGIPEDMFVRLIESESGFDPTKTSSAGAQGIAQLMPVHKDSVDPSDPVEALYYAANLLASHHRTFGAWDKAAAAYVSGPGNVQNAVEAGGVAWQQSLMDILKPEERLQVQQYIAYVTDKAPGAPEGGLGGAGVPWPKLEDYTDNVTGRLDRPAYERDILIMVEPYAKSGTPLPDEAPDMARMIYDSMLSELEPDTGAERRSDLASYIDALVDTLTADVSARRLRLDEAVHEFDRELKAKDWATAAWTEMARYAVPAGEKYLPGFGPGEVATKVGMEPVEADPQWFDPFEMARQMVEGTPSPAAVGAPETEGLFERVLAMVQSGQVGGAGGGGMPAAGVQAGGGGVLPPAPGGIPWTPVAPGWAGVPERPRTEAGGGRIGPSPAQMTHALPGTGVMSGPPPGAPSGPPPGAPTGYSPQSGWEYDRVLGKWVWRGLPGRPAPVPAPTPAPVGTPVPTRR